MFIIQLSEAVCYDMLSIYHVKMDKFPENMDAWDNMLEFDCQLGEQAGYPLHDQIKHSDEYKNLYNVNKKLFELVDEVKKDPCLGKIVDDYVLLRFKAKTALQKRFFPGKKLGEQKFGYEQKN